MTVSWVPPGSLPNSYTVTAQPGGLTATVAGSATSATLTTTLSGVAYNVSIVATYSGSTQTATATLVSPPAALAVPMTTDVVPWLWFDAADPTTVRCNSSGVLTELYNKGTSGGTTNGTIAGSPVVGTSINGRNTITFPTGSTFTTPSISVPAKDVSLFMVISLPSGFIIPSAIKSCQPILGLGLGHLSTYLTTDSAKLSLITGFNSVGNTLSADTSTNVNTVGTMPQLYSVVNSANNYIGMNGTARTPFGFDLTASGAYTTSSTYRLFAIDNGAAYMGGTLAELIVIRANITATQRLQIEGYLAWKWGLQANLPAAHPFSTANMTTTMALYNRPRLYSSVFVPSFRARAIISDSQSNLYTASDSTNNVRKYNTAGVLQWTVSSVGGVNIMGPWRMSRDNSDNIYVAEDAGQRIIKITSAGVATVFKSGIVADSLAVDSTGAVYYHDRPANNIKKITADGVTTTTFYSGSGKHGMACDASNNIYAMFNRVILKIAPNGTATTFVGTGTAGAADGIGTDATLNGGGNSDMQIDSRGYLYVAEFEGKKVRQISPAGVVLTITGQAGVVTPTTATTDGIDINARYGLLTGAAPAPNGSVYITDIEANNVRKLGLGSLNQVGSYVSRTSTYQSVADGYGNLYVGSYSGNNVTRVSPIGITTTFVGSGTSGSTNGAGTSASFNSASGVIRDELGNLYIAEHAGNRIRKVSPAGLVTTFVSIASPLGLTMGPDGNIYASTHSDHTIRQITRAGVMSLYAGASGQIGTTNNVHRLSARFNHPCHLAFDASGIMYIADGNNNLIRKIDLSSNVTTFAGSGASAVSDGTGTNAGIFSPHGIAFDANNIMYVSEWVGSSIRRITPSAVVSTIASGLSACSYCHIDSAQNLWVSNTGNNLVRHIAINAVPTGSVSITGTLLQDQTITANVSTLADSDGLGTFSYVWSSSASAGGVYTTIAGATGASLTLAEAHVGRFIRVRVSYTDGRGSAEAVSTTTVSSIVNVNDNAVGLDISGSFIRGQTLTAVTANIVDPDGNAPPYTYRWSSSTLPSSGFVDISGATASTYVLTTADIGRYIRLTVSYTNNYGSADSAIATSATVVINDNTTVSGTLDISGNLREDAVVRAVANLVDPDGLGPLTYIWSTSDVSNGVFRTDASGVDLSGITLSFGQTARFLRVEVQYVDLKGKAENMISTVIGPIVAHGPPDAPTVSAISAGEASATITWAPPINNGGRPITGYEVRDDLGNFVLAVDSSASSVVIPNLLPGISRRFTVVALNVRGTSALSSLSASVTPNAPSIASIESGQVPEVIAVPLIVAGIPAIVQKVTPVVEADGTKSVVFAPEPEKTAVAIANLPAEVEKVVVATAAPQNGYTTLKISAFDSAGSNVSDFAESPLTITITIPGYTAATLLVRTFQEIGGPATETLTATRNQDGSYTMTLSHLTYIRVSENVPCFVAGTKILTAAGYKAVEDIKDGELIATADGRALPCKMYITEIDETIKENAPYLIPANTFAPRCPAKDITLSPLHAIQLRRGVWQIPKIAATMYAGVRQMPIGSACTYYHLEMPNYLTDNIVAEGTVVESYGARQLAGRRVAYKFDDVVGGFVRTITDARARAPVKRA